MLNPQLDRRGELNHLLTTEGLPRRHVERLLETAAADAAAGPARPDPAPELPVYMCLPDATAADRESYVAAATRLSLATVELDAGKDGSLAEAFGALAPSLLVLRHGQSGAAHCAAAHAAPGVRIINAGDGWHADPLPALALVQAILQIKHDLTNVTVTLVGDIRRSRLARSVIHVLTTLGVPEVRAAAPRALLPESLPQLGVRACATLREGLSDADVIIVLPWCVEHKGGALLPSAQEYAGTHGLTSALLAAAKPDALLLPAGTLACGVEVDADIAAGIAPVVARVAELEHHLRVAALRILAGGSP